LYTLKSDDTLDGPIIERDHRARIQQSDLTRRHGMRHGGPSNWMRRSVQSSVRKVKRRTRTPGALQPKVCGSHKFLSAPKIR